MKTAYLFFFFFIFSPLWGLAQMWNGVDTLYGNEWINYDQTYYKIAVAEDGIYRVSAEAMEVAGIPINQIQGTQLQLFHLGEEQPIYTTTSVIFTDEDYIEFYGRKNRSELDQHLFEKGDSTMLNPWYSLVTDTATYYLTWNESGQSGLRFQTIDNNLTELPPKEEWYWFEETVFYTDQAAKHYDILSGGNVYHSFYDREGFSTEYRKEHSITLPTNNAYLGGPLAELNLRLLSIDRSTDEAHWLEVEVENNILITDTFNNSQFRSFDFELNLNSANAVIDIGVRGNNGDNDRYAVGGASLRYPRNFDADNHSDFYLRLPSSSTERYLEVENLGGNGIAVLYDLTGNTRIIPTFEDGLWKAKLPVFPSVERELLISRAHIAVNNLSLVSFTDYHATQDIEYLIITSQALRADGMGNDQVQAYADYRAISGGGYKVAIVNIEDLYDQYAYGVQRHPLSIRNFINDVYEVWDNLQYCFLIGKGREYKDIRQAEEIENAMNKGFLHLPAYGWPASDNLLISDGISPVPLIPTGRLAAISGEEVRIYLDKVQAMEDQFDNPQAIGDRAWMHRLMHLGGGRTVSEQNTIKAYLESMETVIAQNYYGADVEAFYKTSTEPIQSDISDQIFKTINEGTSIITFFGHSSPGTFDFNIDNPGNYLNAPKYPLMLSLGCYSGNVFVDGRSIGERFTFYENKAAVAFGASIGLGFISSLGSFARSYYDNLGGNYYGQGIGDALKATLDEYSTQPFIGISTLVEQFILHGDPAIQLYPSQQPDFVIDPTNVSFEPTIVSAIQDSFSLKMDVLNIGKNIGDTVVLTISRVFPNGMEKEVIRDTIGITSFRQSFSYKLPTEGKAGAGLNVFKAMVDANDAVFELSETNNRLQTSGNDGIRLFIVDNSARPIYPINFSVVGNDSITFKAASTNILAPERTYLLELDTTASFKSSFLQTTSITQSGGVINWTPTVEWRDSTTYFWRISPDSISTEIGYTWEESTFTFIKSNEEGWRQGGIWQLKDGESSGIEYDSTNTFSFSPEGFFITLKLKKYDDEQDPPAYVFNFQGIAGSVKPWDFMDEGIGVVVGDSITGSGWLNPPGGNYGSINNPLENTRVFAFPTETSEGRANLIQFLDEVVPPKNYVILFTILNTDTSSLGVEQWGLDSISLGKNLFSLLENEGALAIRSLEQLGSVHYGLMYQKGEGRLTEGIAASLNEILNIETYFPIEGYEGRYTSPLFGSTDQWKNIYYHFDNLEANDSLGVDLIGVTTTGEEVELLTGLTSGQDISQLNPRAFPGLKLAFYARDIVDRTSPQLRYWAIDGQFSPDLSIHPLQRYAFHADTLQKGDDLRLSYFIEPVLKTIMDSVMISYSVKSADNQVVGFNKWLLEGIGTSGKIDSLVIDASVLSVGDNSLLVEVNSPNGYTEQTYFNNILNQPFFVNSDRRNPILDVTFDGRKIINGDIVSPKPIIVIRLEDENEFLLLEDSSTFELELITPEGVVNNIALDDESVLFMPATSTEDNEASISYQPKFEESGIYQLRVRGEDASGNSAGKYDYEISFEVILENSISNIFNYPNPFSTSTQFVYTLTGEQPVFYKLQIMTVSGRVVKEISEAELGPLEIGTHRTEYAWDGTDDYGDRLANGVYLYRFIAKDGNGESFEKYERETDRFFKNGIGKLVILR